jgi:hypothetical protein
MRWRSLVGLGDSCSRPCPGRPRRECPPPGRVLKAQQVKYSTGTEPPKLNAPPNATDCHHHIYDTSYPVDPGALATFGPSARMVAVVNDTVSTEELKRMHALGVRGVRFNLAQAGATTPDATSCTMAWCPRASSCVPHPEGRVSFNNT